MDDIKIIINNYQPPYQEHVHIDLIKNEIIITGIIPDDPDYFSKMTGKSMLGDKDTWDVYLVRHDVIFLQACNYVEIDITMEMYALSQKYTIKLCMAEVKQLEYKAGKDLRISLKGKCLSIADATIMPFEWNKG